LDEIFAPRDRPALPRTGGDTAIDRTQPLRPPSQ
jgi:hypothetical protein